MEVFTTGQILLTVYLCITCLIFGATLLNINFKLFHKADDVSEKMFILLISFALLLPIINLFTLILIYKDMKNDLNKIRRSSSLNELVHLIMINKDYRIRDTQTISNDKLNIRITTGFIRHDESEHPISKENKKLLLNILSEEDKYSPLLTMYKEQKKA